MNVSHRALWTRSPRQRGLANNHGAVLLLSVYFLSLSLLLLSGISLERTIMDLQAAKVSRDLQQAFWMAEGGADRVLSQLKTNVLTFQDGQPFPCGATPADNVTCTIRVLSSSLGLGAATDANVQSTVYEVLVTAANVAGRSATLTMTVRHQSRYSGMVASGLVRMDKNHWTFDDPPITVIGDVRTSMGKVDSVELHGTTVNGGVTIGPPDPTGQPTNVPAYTHLTSTPPDYQADGIYLAPSLQWWNPLLDAHVTGAIGAQSASPAPALNVPTSCTAQSLILEQPGTYYIRKDPALGDEDSLSLCVPAVYLAPDVHVIFQDPARVYVTGTQVIRIQGEYRSGDYLVYNDGQIGVSPDLTTRPDRGVTVIAPPTPGSATTPPLFLGNFTGSIHAPASYVDLARAAGDKDRGDLSVPPQRTLGFVVAQSINVAGANLLFPNTPAGNSATSPNAGVSVLSWSNGDRSHRTTLAAAPSAEVYYPSASSAGLVPEAASIAVASVPPDWYNNWLNNWLPPPPPDEKKQDDKKTDSDHNSDGGIHSVICTELHRQGYLPDAWYAADVAYQRAYVDARTFAVYHAWAIPVAQTMRRSALVTYLVRPFSLAWAQHMAYVMGAADEDSALGWWLTEVGLPIHRFLGHLGVDPRT